MLASQEFDLEIAAGENERTLALSGVLSGAAAAEVERALEGATGWSARVVIDFTRVRYFSDFGLAVLARALGRWPAGATPVALRGLRDHQIRIFRYLGLDPARRLKAGHS